MISEAFRLTRRKHTLTVYLVLADLRSSQLKLGRRGRQQRKTQIMFCDRQMPQNGTFPQNQPFRQCKREAQPWPLRFQCLILVLVATNAITVPIYIVSNN